LAGLYKYHTLKTLCRSKAQHSQKPILEGDFVNSLVKQRPIHCSKLLPDSFDLRSALHHLKMDRTMACTALVGIKLVDRSFEGY
jgi:hypothetical protein